MTIQRPARPSKAPHAKAPDPIEMRHPLIGLVERGHKLVVEFLERQNGQSESGPMSGLGIGEAFAEMAALMLADPAKLAKARTELWQDYLRLAEAASRRFMGEPAQPKVSPNKDDKRFRDPAWQESPVFEFIKESYLSTSKWLHALVTEVDGLDENTARKVDFYTRQFLDAIAPTNFVLTNPQVLRTTLKTGGDNLIKGLENLVGDLERGEGRLLIKMTDSKAFRIGETIAAAPGAVVYQNALMQLIQYAPTTERVHKRPLVILPPWINKFYVLDLRPENSFVRWAVDQGHTVFIVSWINPDPGHAAYSFDDYIKLGFLDVLDAVEKATGERESNMIGYCLGGTLLASGLAVLAAREQQERVASATYFVTLVDFTDVGDIRVFIDDAQLDALDAKMKDQGYLDAKDLHAAFNMLRANDLIWSFVVNNYLLGKEPFPLDLLYWNTDATHMPAAMQSFYLRNMYQKNLLTEPGSMTLQGEPIDLSRIRTPTYILAAKEDHIAPWRSVYAGTQLYAGPRRFVLSESGHIAGVVNPPAANKYGYWINDALPPEPEAWLMGARRRDGSWWVDWQSWAEPHGAEMVRPRKPGDGSLKPLEDAPGSYVKQRAM